MYTEVLTNGNFCGRVWIRKNSNCPRKGEDSTTMSLKKQMEALATLIATHSLALREGDVALLMMRDVPPQMTAELIAAARHEGAGVVLREYSDVAHAALLSSEIPDLELAIHRRALTALAKDCTAAVRMNCATRPGSRASVLPEQEKRYGGMSGPIYKEYVIDPGRWLMTTFPTAQGAKLAGMTVRQYRQMVFNATIGVNHTAMLAAMTEVSDFLRSATHARIVAPGTDLTFELAPGVELGDGRKNLPGGLVMVKAPYGSFSGTYRSNVRTSNRGVLYERVTLTFKDGVIVAATAGDRTDQFNALLDTDEGARRVGEFQFGCNPAILSPTTGITVLDENASGTVTIGVGNSYNGLPHDNGNRSDIHIDVPLSLHPSIGGGSLAIDDVVVIEDGEFVGPLRGLRTEFLRTSFMVG